MSTTPVVSQALDVPEGSVGVKVDTVQMRVPANLGVSALAGPGELGSHHRRRSLTEIRATSIMLEKQVLELDASWFGREL